MTSRAHKLAFVLAAVARQPTRDRPFYLYLHTSHFRAAELMTMFSLLRMNTFYIQEEHTARVAVTDNPAHKLPQHKVNGFAHVCPESWVQWCKQFQLKKTSQRQDTPGTCLSMTKTEGIRI